MAEREDASSVQKKRKSSPSRITPVQRRRQSRRCKRLVRRAAPRSPRSPKRQVGG